MNLSHLFQDTITWSSPASFNDGDLVQGPSTTASARVVEAYTIVKMASGEERAASFKIATAADIPINSRVYVPGANVGTPEQSLTVLQRRTAKTLDGSYRYYIYLLGA